MNYTIDLNGGSVTIASDSMRLSAPINSNRYPLVVLNPSNITLPIDSVEISFRYETVTGFGAGPVVDDEYPLNGSFPDVGNTSILWVWNWGITPSVKVGYFPNIFNTIANQFESHTMKIVGLAGNYSSYIDGIYLGSITDDKVISSIWFGNPEITATLGNWPTILIDKIIINDSSIPSFPYFSQKDPAWGDHEYDSASEWAGVDKSGIDRWGCALTSATMMLEEYGVKALDDSPINPDILNDWLNEQSDGYVGPGFVNWLAITRFAKDRLPDGKSLEFERSYDPALLTLPSILGLPGHFVVAYDEDTTNWSINDPANSSNSNLAKTTTLRSINRYIPSLTDLSYMMFVMNSGMSASLKNSAGEAIPLDWVEEYLSDDIDDTDGASIKTAMLPKPSNNTYTLTVNQPESTENELKIFLYSETADEASPSAFTVTEPVTNYEIIYASESAGVRSAIEVDLNPPPVPSLLSPDDEAVATDSGLILDWSDVSDPSEPVSYNYKSTWSGGGYGPVSTGTESSFSASSSPDSTFTWYAQACDAENNCSEWSSGRTVVVDSTAPTLPSSPTTTPSPTNLTTQDWSWMPGSDSGSGILGYSTRTYDVILSSYPFDWLWIGDLLATSTSLAEGKWQLQVMASDKAGNKSETQTSETLVVDTTAPVLASQTSFEDKWYGSEQNVSFEYSDANMLSSYEAPSCSITTASSASYCWVKPYICDTAGNCNNEQVFSTKIKLDMTKPSVSLDVWGSELKGTASDTLSGIAKVVIQLTKPGATEETLTASGTTSWNYVIDKALVGSYKVKVMAYDNADNISSTIERTYDINASDPAQTPSTTPTPTPTPSPTAMPDLISISTFTPLPSPSPILSPTPSGAVLGEETIPKKINYWWLLTMAPISFVVYLLAIKK